MAELALIHSSRGRDSNPRSRHHKSGILLTWLLVHILWLAKKILKTSRFKRQNFCFVSIKWQLVLKLLPLIAPCECNLSLLNFMLDNNNNNNNNNNQISTLSHAKSIHDCCYYFKFSLSSELLEKRLNSKLISCNVLVCCNILAFLLMYS